MGSGAPLVELRGIRKVFSGAAALDGVSLSVGRGMIHGLLGENGAGKSTLMNILYGLYSPDAGEIRLEGKRAVIRSPEHSIRQGIGMVHQSSTLVDEFNALENIVLGSGGPAFSSPLGRRRASIEKLRDSFGFDFPLDVKIKELPAGIKQKIEITRALYRRARLLILDEPTTSLVESEFRQLLTSLRALVASGMTVILITHKIKEVLEACDSVTVLRKGTVRGGLEKSGMSTESLVRLMFEEKDIRVTEQSLPKIELTGVPRGQAPVLSLRSVTVAPSDRSPGLSELSLELYGGEILGVAAVSGNGEKELAEICFKTERLAGGDILLEGESLRGLSTLEVIGRGLAYTPEDRVREGILPEASLRENILLGHHRRARFLRHGLFLDWEEAGRAARAAIKEYSIYTPHDRFPIRRLSGGNIQKAIIGRAFVSPIKALITHNPSSGLDISTVEFIFRKLVETRGRGGAVLWINEDLDELILLSDRIAVLHRGGLAGVIQRSDFDKYRIGLLMIGGAA